MLELALHKGNGPMMMQTIAENQHVSRKYLDTIFASLKNAKLIISRRGVGGGHLLAKEPDQILIGDILRAVEGPLSLVDCIDSPEICDRTDSCATMEIWADIGKAIESVIDHITLADLVERHLTLTDPGSTLGACPSR